MFYSNFGSQIFVAPSIWRDIPNMSIETGSIVEVRSGEEVPADLIILQTSDEEVKTFF